MKYSLSDLLPLIIETLASGREFTLPVTGTSMLPLLVEKRDSVILKKAVPPLKKGDLPLYRRADGSFVLHRIVSVKNGEYIMSGDNQFDPEYGINDGMVIGVVEKISRKGETFDVRSPFYRLYVFLWTRLFKVRYPLRRLRRSAKKTDESTPAAKLPEPKPCVTYLITLLGCALNGAEPPPVPENVDLDDVYRLAAAHRVANMAAYSVLKLNDLNMDIRKKFMSELFKVAQRESAQHLELKKIEERLAAENIEYCVLKGNEIAKHYPATDMRFSLDIDIYVAARDVSRAERIMLGLGYVQEGQKNTKDIAFVKKPNLTVEIHFDLNFETDLTHDYFAELLCRLSPESTNSRKLKMTGEDLFIYVTGHAAHHFLVAGTGIRSITDDYVLRKKLLPDCDAGYIDGQLKKAGLYEFSRAAERLGKYWFENGEADSVIKRLEKYVIESGIFGTYELFYTNSAAPQSKIGGSRFRYVLGRILPSYTLMTALYPVLRKIPALLPLFWTARWFKIIKNIGRVSGEVSKIAAIDEEKVKDRSDLFGKMGFN